MGAHPPRRARRAAHSCAPNSLGWGESVSTSRLAPELIPGRGMGAPSLDHLLLALPRCARCGVDVERLEQHDDAVADGRVVTVECHGDIEVCIVRHADLRAARPGSFRYLLAFSAQAYQGWR